MHHRELRVHRILLRQPLQHTELHLQRGRVDRLGRTSRWTVLSESLSDLQAVIIDSNLETVGELSRLLVWINVPRFARRQEI